MSVIINHSVVSEGNTVINKWNLRNPSGVPVSPYCRIGITRTKVFGEDWSIIIRKWGSNSTRINIYRSKFKKNRNIKQIQINILIKNENKLFWSSGEQTVLLQNDTLNVLNRDILPVPILNQNTSSIGKDETAVQITCTVKWLNAPASYVHLKSDERSFKNKQDFQKLAQSDGLELLSGDFKKLLETGANADLTIDVNGHTIRAHQSVLEARCPVFAAMFSHDMSENQTRYIQITDCEPESFSDFLTYLYTGKLHHIKPRNALDLYEISDKYDRPELKELCKEYLLITLSLDTFFDILCTASMHNDSEMMEAVTIYFIENGFEIVRTIEWQLFAMEHPNLANEFSGKAFPKGTVIT